MSDKSSRRSSPRVSYVPAPSHLSAKDLLEKHPNRLFYNNILKVALQYDNLQIDGQLMQLGYAKYIAYDRIKSATRWIEKLYKISSGAFLIAFNRESNRNGIYRPVHESPKDEIMLVRNAVKINEAMAWVKRGGSRIATTSPSPESRRIVAPVSTNANTEKEAEPTAASIFDKKLKEAQASKYYVCPHPYCSCTFTTASDNYKHICEVHFHASETLVQRAKARQIAGPLGWVDLP